MIKATCDNCGKDLGEVPFERIKTDGPFRVRLAVKVERNFAAKGNPETSHLIVACSENCVKALDAKDGHERTALEDLGLSLRFGGITAIEGNDTIN